MQQQFFDTMKENIVAQLVRVTLVASARPQLAHVK
jgi:hypothetical protein